MKNRFYNNGLCKLIEEPTKCMYGEKYAFCEDCTRYNLIHMEETHYENEEE